MGLYVGGVGVGVTDAAGAIAATDVADRLKLSGRAAEVPTASCLAVSPGASRMALPSSFVEPVGGAAVAAAAAAAAATADGVDDVDDEEQEELMGGRDTDAGDVILRRGKGRDVDEDRLFGRDGGGCAAGSLPGCERLMIRAHVATLMFIWL